MCHSNQSLQTRNGHFCGKIRLLRIGKSLATMPASDQNTVSVAILIAILVLMFGLAKGGFGGLGVLLTPLLALVLPVAMAVGVLLPMLMVGDVFAVYLYWKEWDLDLV